MLITDKQFLVLNVDRARDTKSYEIVALKKVRMDKEKDGKCAAVMLSRVCLSLCLCSLCKITNLVNVGSIIGLTRLNYNLSTKI